ncbi:NAD(P)H-dependent oxidoreductase [Cohnella zeiphila]|uniref:NAD(P)H-dependent oxidoreductase n=1 Tax=Cohnella zeiphila TaxID=2761120 RepID=A0A7X0SPY6_9BACL|nr:NAD(P)H-dependent oxidoreductase [Cohnella zeiphila]
MKIAAIVGSIRKDSYNRKLAEHVKNRYQDRFETEVLTLNGLPMYNQDIENDPPEAVRVFKDKVKAADAILWVTPEYNGTVPGVLVNAIDWMSRVDKVLVGKPSLIMGATPGLLGTVKAQLHLRDILFAPGVSSPIMTANDVYVGSVHEKMDAEGKLTHEPTIQFIDTVVNNFLAWIAK